MRATVTVEEVGPRKAQSMLDSKLESERHVRTGHVERLAAMMRAGHFRLSSDAVVLVRNRLANGQHRLAAIVRANMPQKFIVMRCDDDSLYKILDSGIKRTAGDVFSARNAPHSNITAAARRLVVLYHKGLLRTICPLASRVADDGSLVIFTRSDIVDVDDAELRLLCDLATFVGPLRKKYGLMSSSVATAFLALVHPDDTMIARDFITSIYEGTNIARGTPAHLMRSVLILDCSRASRPGTNVLGLLIKSFNAQLTGDAPKGLRFSINEAYPSLIRCREIPELMEDAPPMQQAAN